MAKKKTVTMKGGDGKKPVTFQKGALHRQLGVPAGEKIPAAKMAKAMSGAMGPMAKKRAVMAKGMLAAGRRTANANKKKGR